MITGLSVYQMVELFYPWGATILTIAAVVLAYIAGRRTGIDVGAEGMFDLLEESGAIETATQWNADGEEETIVIKDGKPIKPSW